MIERLKKHPVALLYAASFLLPVLVMVGIFALDGVYPFGDKTVFNSDLTNIYSSYLAHYKDMITGGDGVFWSWNIGMGYNMYSYFIDNTSSPLNLVLLLVPDANLPEGVLFIQLIRVGLMGLAAAWYFNHHELRMRHAFILAFAYALSAYTVCYFQHVMWMDSLAVLPLTVYATEMMVRDKRVLSLPLLGSLILAFWCSYYLGYMTAMFLIFYTVYRTVITGGGARASFFNLCKLALAGVLTFLVLGAAIVPSIYANLGSGGFVDLALKPYFSFPDITYGLYVGNFDSYQPYGRPMVYCGLFTVFAIIFYFFNQDIDRRSKWCTGALFAVFAVSLMCAPVYYAWHMFDQPDWFEARFSFTLIFFMLIVAGQTVKHRSGIQLRTVLIAAAIILAVFVIDTLVFNALPDTDTYTAKIGALRFTVGRHKLAWPLIALNVAVIAAYTCCFACLCGAKTKTARTVARRILLIACVLEVSCNAMLLNQYVSHNEVYQSRSAFNEDRANVSSLVNTLREGTANDYRTEKTFNLRENDSLTDDYYGLAMFGSGYNPGVHDILHQLGLRSTYKMTRYQGSTPVIDSLLGVRDVMVKDTLEAPGADATLEDQVLYRKRLGGQSPYIRTLYDRVATHNDMGAYENQWALPIAYLVNSDITKIKVKSNHNPFDLQNKIVQSVFDTDESCFTTIDDATYDAHGLTYTVDDSNAGSLVLAADGSLETPYLDITVPAQDDSLFFAYARSLKNSDLVDYQVWNETTGTFVSKTYDFATTYSDRTVELQQKDGTYTYRIVLHGNKARITNPIVARMDISTFKSIFSTDKRNDLITSFGSDRVEVNGVTSEAGKKLFLTVPYDEGWSATLNGQPVQIEKALGGFSVISLPACQNADVVLTYAPQGWNLGLTLTIVGLVATGALVGVRALRSRKTLR